MKLSLFSIAVFAPAFATLNAQQVMRTVTGPAGALSGKVGLPIPDQNADGFDDLLIGAPGFNQQRGEIVCISGGFLASGTGAVELWSSAPVAAAGDQFGFAIAIVGDLTGDGVDDYLVGQPGYD